MGSCGAQATNRNKIPINLDEGSKIFHRFLKRNRTRIDRMNCYTHQQKLPCAGAKRKNSSGLGAGCMPGQRRDLFV